MSRARSNSSHSSYSSSSSSSNDREDDGREDSARRKPRKAMTDRSTRSKSSSPGQSPEGRTRVIMTHREPVSYAASSKALRWQRLEPKFEPRYDYYRSKPMINGVKSDSSNYYQHRRKVVEAKPVVDNRPPQIFSHVYCNMKKLRINQERQDVIEKENKMLLGKLVNAMTTRRVDNWNSNTDPKGSPGKRRSRHHRDGYQNEAEYRKWQERKSDHVTSMSSDYGSEYSERSPTRYRDTYDKTSTRDRERERQKGFETKSRYN